jgi:transposase
MYPRVSRVKVKGKTYEYLRIVEAVRDEKGRNRQRVIANLGRIDQIGDKLDGLVEKLRRFCGTEMVLPEEVQNRESVTWGQILLLRHLWEELELDRIIEKCCQGRHGWDVAEHAFVLAANRLCEPHSEHGLARWLDATYVCDSCGGRFLPDWLPADEVSKEQRVKVTWSWLQTWYRTLDAVLAGKSDIEHELYLRLRDLFHLRVDVAFYDLTTLYFERREPVGALRRHGKSKDGKPRNVQVLLGIVMVNGFPLAGHLFSGNQSEKLTVKEVVDDLRSRFEVGEVVFVTDNGMNTPENRKLLQGIDNYHYLYGHKTRRDALATRWLQGVDEGRWVSCPRETFVQEVDSSEDSMRVFIAQNSERRDYEAELRQRSMERVEARMQRLQAAVAEGKVVAAAVIGARAARAVQHDHGSRYFSYRIDGDGSFSYWLDAEKLARETAQEGRYIVVTDHPAISPEEAVARYKELSDVEDGFRSFKDIIEGRPVYHKTDGRIMAHLFIAQLALLVNCHLRRRLDDAGLELSPRDALAAVKSLGVSTLSLNGTDKLLVAGRKRDCARVLKAFGIDDPQPPGTTRRHTAPKTPETTM